jgi:enoyl-CoA hydratase/carnithine racemase
VSEAPHALVERDGPVLIVTMNRPEARNALSPDMLRIMSEAWDDGLSRQNVSSAMRCPRATDRFMTRTTIAL